MKKLRKLIVIENIYLTIVFPVHKIMLDALF